MQYRNIYFISASNAAAIISGLIAASYLAKFIRIFTLSTQYWYAIIAGLGIVSSSDNITSVCKAKILVWPVKLQIIAEGGGVLAASGTCR